MARRTIKSLRQQTTVELGTDGHDASKTAGMFRLERLFRKDIAILLQPVMGETDRHLSFRLGVSISLISKWRKRLGIKVQNSTRFKRR